MLSILGSSYCHDTAGETALNLDLMLKVDKRVLGTPVYGVRQVKWRLQITRDVLEENHIRRLMRLLCRRRDNHPQLI